MRVKKREPTTQRPSTSTSSTSDSPGVTKWSSSESAPILAAGWACREEARSREEEQKRSQLAPENNKLHELRLALVELRYNEGNQPTASYQGNVRAGSGG